MPSKITSRIATQAGIPDLHAALTDRLSASDLQSLLLTVYQNRARTIRESELMARAERHALNAPCEVDARLLNRFDRIAYAAAEAFEAIELSPVCPFGTATLLGSIDQNSVRTTIRNAEVLSDSTLAMAVECSRRRKNPTARRTQAAVRLCSSHRLVRLQPVSGAGMKPHFRLFGLASAGRDSGSMSFEIEHLSEHFRFYLRLFRDLNAQGFQVTNPLMEVSDLAMTEAMLDDAGVSPAEVGTEVRAHKPGSSKRFLAARGITLPEDIVDPGRELLRVSRLDVVKSQVFDPLQEEFPEARFRFNLARLEGLGYYMGLCLRVTVDAPDGTRFPIGDGGFLNWTARLLQDKKERLLTSGMGSELICRFFLAAP